MYQSIITFDCQAFDTEEHLQPVWDLLARWPSLELVEYDLNQMEQWRAWEPSRAWVDALTQRTQLFRARGEEALVMIAMGKHGEPPTVVVQSSDPLENTKAALMELSAANLQSVRIVAGDEVVGEWSGEGPLDL